MRALMIFALTLVLGIGWATQARADEEALTRVEAKELYLEAYTQRVLNPAAAKRKLQQVVAGVSADFEYHQKATHLLEQMRADASTASAKNQRRLRRKSPSTVPPAETETEAKKTAFPPPDPSSRLYVGPVITAGEAHAKGVSRFQKGQFEAALPFFVHAVELDPEGHALTLKMLGITYARLGEKCLAARHYQAYVDARPEAADASKVRQILSHFAKNDGARDCEAP